MSLHDWRNYKTCECGERGCFSRLRMLGIPTDSLAAAPVRGEGEALPGREAAGASPCAAVPAREGAETEVQR